MADATIGAGGGTMFLVCGEALFDFFLEDEEGPGAARFAARAGGSPFNVAVGLSRLGHDAGLFTGLSDDLLGRRLAQVLAVEGVSTRYAVPTRRPTTISLVGLDAAGVPAYQFYGAGAADTGLTPDDLPSLGADIEGLHLGSYSLAVAPVADALATLVRAERNRFLSLDPNIRPSIEPDMAVWRTRIEALLPAIDMIKISAEDLALLHPGRDAEDYAAAMIAGGVGLVVVTDGGAPVRGFAATGARASIQPPAVAVVDTVGAGDTFEAALLAGLLEHPDGPAAAIAGLDDARLAALLALAARAAAITCSRRGADLPRAADLA